MLTCMVAIGLAIGVTIAVGGLFVIQVTLHMYTYISWLVDMETQLHGCTPLFYFC